MGSFWVMECVAVTFLYSLQEHNNIAGGEYVNVALGKHTSQKDTVLDGYSGRAVDGDYESNFDHNSCTHTSAVNSWTWWSVDLLQAYLIHHVTIVNRDILCDRLTNFTIYVSKVTLDFDRSQDMSSVCTRHEGPLPCDGPHIITCDRVTRGRYVYLWKPDYEALTLCEFGVFWLSDKHATFTIKRGWKSLLLPFYSESVVSILRCAFMCMYAPGGVAKVVQLEKATKNCQCIQKSVSDNMDSSTNEAAGWILLEVTNN